jgi:hypothetical protein
LYQVLVVVKEVMVAQVVPEDLNKEVLAAVAVDLEVAHNQEQLVIFQLYHQLKVLMVLLVILVLAAAVVVLAVPVVATTAAPVLL